MSSICVLVADSYRARIFEAVNRTSALVERQTLLCPEAVIHEQDTTSKLPGSSFGSLFNSSFSRSFSTRVNNMRHSRHRVIGKANIQQQLSLQFANDIVKEFSKKPYFIKSNFNCTA